MQGQRLFKHLGLHKYIYILFLLCSFLKKIVLTIFPSICMDLIHLVDYLVFYAVSEIFQQCNGNLRKCMLIHSKTELMKNLLKYCIAIIKGDNLFGKLSEIFGWFSRNINWQDWKNTLFVIFICFNQNI